MTLDTPFIHVITTTTKLIVGDYNFHDKGNIVVLVLIGLKVAHEFFNFEEDL